MAGLHHIAGRLLHGKSDSQCSVQQVLKGFMECVRMADHGLKDRAQILSDLSDLLRFPMGA